MEYLDYDADSQNMNLESEFDFASFVESNDMDTISTTEFLQKTKKPKKAKNDNDCRILKKNIEGVLVKIPCFTTKSVVGAKIRDATNGIYYDFHVGKKDEDLFFKMRDVTGNMGDSKTGNDLYFDSPEHCERYLKITIPSVLKEEWKEKHKIAKLKMAMKTQRSQSHSTSVETVDAVVVK